MASLVERLRALYVWPQSVADHYADTLTPRQIKQLYEVGFAADEAADRITALEAKVKRTLTDHGRMLWRDDVEGHCPNPNICFEYGETVRCSPCAIKQSLAEGVEPAMPDHTYSPEVARLTREVDALKAEIANLRPQVTIADDQWDAKCDRITALEAMCETLAGALDAMRSYGCPVCNGDCAGANPPVIFCPMTQCHEALTQYRAMKEKNDANAGPDQI